VLRGELPSRLRPFTAARFEASPPQRVGTFA
jgi:hypothetical protein